LCNGNVRTGDDAECNLIASGADGIMSAEGLLDDPALFVRSSSPDGVPSRLQLAFEYLGLVDSYPVPIKSVVFHVRRMAKQELTQFQVRLLCVNKPFFDFLIFSFFDSYWTIASLARRLLKFAKFCPKLETTPRISLPLCLVS
jgi:tRNA-dihydrouridine synthase